MKIGDRVEVHWLDAQSGTGLSVYIEELEDLEPLRSISFGVLLLQKKEHIILGTMTFGEERVKHYQLIPRGMIKKIKILR